MCEQKRAPTSRPLARSERCLQQGTSLRTPAILEKLERTQGRARDAMPRGAGKCAWIYRWGEDLFAATILPAIYKLNCKCEACQVGWPTQAACIMRATICTRAMRLRVRVDGPCIFRSFRPRPRLRHRPRASSLSSNVVSHRLREPFLRLIFKPVSIQAASGIGGEISGAYSTRVKNERRSRKYRFAALRFRVMNTFFVAIKFCEIGR